MKHGPSDQLGGGKIDDGGNTEVRDVLEKCVEGVYGQKGKLCGG